MMKTPGLLTSGLLLLIAANGCATPGKNAAEPTKWDHTRLRATLQLADEHIAAGKFERARAALASFEGSPDPQLQLTLARIDVEQGCYDAALRRLDGKGATAAHKRLRGVSLEASGQWAAAAEAYEQAYRSEPSACMLVAWLDAAVLDGQAAAALATLQRERKRYPGELEISLLAARLQGQLGNHAAAVDELSTALLTDPESETIRRQLAEAYMAAGRTADAAGLWRELIASGDDPSELRRLRHRLADCLLATDRHDEAREVYRTLVLGEPSDQKARLGLAVTGLASDKPAEALEAARELIRAGDGGTEARLIAALCYRRLNQTDRAIEMLSDIRPADDEDGLVRELLTRWQ